MKLILLIFLTFPFVSLSQTTLKEVRNFGKNPGNLKMLFHESNFKNDTSKHKSIHKPLVVILHGCTQNADNASQESGWSALGNDYGFYTLFPQQRFINNPQRCFNWFNSSDVSKNEGEIGSIKSMIDYAIDSLKIDTNRIFVYGLSAGAVMSAALLAVYPKLFNAGAILAGGAYVNFTSSVANTLTLTNPKYKTVEELIEPIKKQNPGYTGKYPKVIILQGEKDPVVNYKNANQLIKQWNGIHESDSIPDINELNFEGSKLVKKRSYTNAKNEVKVVFYSIAKHGHALIINPGNGPKQGGKIGVFAKDKDFFSTYYIAKDFGLIP